MSAYKLIMRLFEVFGVLLLTAAMGCGRVDSGDASASSRGYAYNFQTEDEEFDSLAATVGKHEFDRRHLPGDTLTLRRMAEIASGNSSPVIRARNEFWQIRFNQIGISPEQALSRLEKVRTQIPPGEEYDYDRACMAYQIAGNHNRLGNYFNTFQLLQEAMPVFEKYHDNYFLGNALLLDGLNYQTIGERDMALKQIHLADSAYRAAGYPTNRVLFFEAEEAGDMAMKIRLNKESVAQGGDDPGMTIQAYMNLASNYADQGDIDSAKLVLRDASLMQARMLPDNLPLHTLIQICRAQLEYKIGNFQTSLALIDSVMMIPDEYKSEFWMTSAYELRHLLADRVGTRDEAYESLREYHEKFQEDVQRAQGQEIPKARAREVIGRQRHRIEQMEQETHDAHTRLYLILLGSTVILLGAAGLAAMLYHRVKLKRIENRELRTNLEQEMIIKRLNYENFERDLKQKECEISSSVLLLSNKNDLLQQIGQLSAQYYQDGRVPREFVEQVNALVGESLKGDDEWTRFKKHFDSVHPDFFTKLKSIGLDLTENDLRLCAYLRIGMRAKDIAAMLNVSPASVNTQRYRIRKKLGLAKEDSLDDFIRRV